MIPGLVYISQPTEYGTLYTLAELTALSETCRKNGLYLYVDGARLAYALCSPENDVSIADLARLTDAFYLGGTKCGALMGEAVVLPNPRLIPRFFTIIKLHGALLAKGRLLGVQFDELMKDGLYQEIGRNAVALAARIQEALKRAGYPLLFESPTNQVFAVLPNERVRALAERVEFTVWEPCGPEHTVVRFVTSWATREEDVDALCALL